MLIIEDKITEDKKTICLYTGSDATRQILCRQLQETLGRNVHILSYAIDEEEPVYENTDLVLLSSGSIEDELRSGGFLKSDMSFLVCGRRINFDNIESVLRIPKGERTLFVNDTRETAEICIQNLRDIGIDHIEYTAYYPGCTYSGGYDYAITPGEIMLVPDGIKEIINIRPRHIDVPSLLKIVDLLGIKDFDPAAVIKPYTDKIIDISKKMAMVNIEVEGIKNILREKLTKKGHTADYNFESIKGDSRILTEVKVRAEKLARTDLTVLIEGESGTGKELFASAIHNASSRKDGPYLAVNFSALPEELVESELFGYEEGAFTGAKKGGKTGLFEQADGGTIFLDEIGDITPRMQTKLLRVLQEKEIMPIGGGNIKKVDIRVIAATNKDLKSMVGSGDFRGDLYYRLKIGYLNTPALRERKEDIRCLAEYFIEREEKRAISVDEEVYETFYQYDWHGNVRELKNTIKYMLAIRENATKITEKELPDYHFFDETAGQMPQSFDEAAGRMPQTFEKATGRMPSNLWSLGENSIDEQGYDDGESLDVHMEAVLKMIYTVSMEGKNPGRAVVTDRLNKQHIMLTENQVRKRIEYLREQKMVTSGRGKRGTLLTDKGITYIMERFKIRE